MGGTPQASQASLLGGKRRASGTAQLFRTPLHQAGNRNVNGKQHAFVSQSEAYPSRVQHPPVLLFF
jgi:hypothetical protein